MKIIFFKNDHQKLDQIESDREYEEKLSKIRKQTQVARTLSLTAIILSSVIGLFLEFIKIILITQKIVSALKLVSVLAVIIWYVFTQVQEPEAGAAA